MSTDPRDLLRHLLRQQGDRRGAVWCAGLCMAHILPDMPDYWSGVQSLRVLLLWAQGLHVSKSRFQKLLSGLPLGNTIAEDAFGGLISGLRWKLWDGAGVITAPTYVAHSLATRHTTGSLVNATARYMQSMVELITHQTTPLPTGNDHPTWDWIAERYPEAQRVGLLGDALARARQWRLRWWVPHERALAERLESSEQLPEWFVRSRRSL